jgi:hypothetical protein
MADLSDSEVESSGGDDSSKEVKTAKRNTRKGRAGKKRTRGESSLCLVRGEPFGGILIHLRFPTPRERIVEVFFTKENSIGEEPKVSQLSRPEIMARD